MIPFTPSIRRDALPALDLTLPMQPWELKSGGVGGSAISVAGIPASYELRVDRIAMVTLRCYEYELNDLITTLEEIRASSEQFTFAFDQDDEYTAYRVYLNSPVWPDEITPDRDNNFLGVFTLALELRTVASAPFLHAFLEEEA